MCNGWDHLLLKVRVTTSGVQRSQGEVPTSRAVSFPSDGSYCLEEKRNALRTGDESGIPIFVPECREDGGYKQVQCHQGTGYCWCVTEEGKPVPGSSVQHSKPFCRLLLQTGRFRRGKRRKGKRGKEEPNESRRKVCTQADRSAFSNNLIEMVSTEHSSLFGAQGRPNGTIIGNARKEVAEWKFEQLDTDRDGVLKKKELKGFRSDIKKVLRPRRCGSSFVRYCDQDSDRKISKHEWRSCIGIEENISFNLFSKLMSEEDEARRVEERRAKGEEGRGGQQRQPGQQQDQAAPPSLYTRQFGTSATAEENSEDDGVGQVEEPVDCATARLESAQEAMQGSEGMFIPECDREGRYLPVQCYKSEGYCWCVEPATGRPIPGTSTRHAAPQCGSAAERISAKPVRKEWKKCEGKKRDVFLDLLFIWMTTLVADKSLPYMFDSEPGLTHNQLVAKKQFIDLDRNRNGILERREVRRWKKALKAEPGLMLCGKRILQHCDSNKDTSISQTEWTSCLGVSKEADSVSRRPLQPVGKRRGPNPLKTWLKGD